MTIKQGDFIRIEYTTTIKETGELFRKELTQFLYNFQEEHEDEVKLLPIDQIGPDSYFTFLLATQFPSLDKLG